MITEGAGWINKGPDANGEEVNMQNLSEDQLRRQDFVDNEIYNLMKRLIPSTREIEWDIEMIGDIRDAIQHWLVDQYKIVDELEFYS